MCYLRYPQEKSNKTARFLGHLEALKIAHELITPQSWMKALGCMTGGDKKISKAKAQALFPQLKITNDMADALLIAEYCRRTVLTRQGKKAVEG